MRKPFSIKWIYLIERRSFDQKYKFSNKNDMVCAWRDFNSTSCVLSRYPKRPVRVEKSSIFNFEYVNEVWISGVLGVKLHCLFIVALGSHQASQKPQFWIINSPRVLLWPLQFTTARIFRYDIKRGSINQNKNHFLSFVGRPKFVLYCIKIHSSILILSLP